MSGSARRGWPSRREQTAPLLLEGLARPIYRVFCTLLYATGLRLKEALMLETSDIDRCRESRCS